MVGEFLFPHLTNSPPRSLPFLSCIKNQDKPIFSILFQINLRLGKDRFVFLIERKPHMRVWPRAHRLSFLPSDNLVSPFLFGRNLSDGKDKRCGLKASPGPLPPSTSPFGKLSTVSFFSFICSLRQMKEKETVDVFFPKENEK